MNCQRCGGELPKDANFCMFCGATVRSEMEILVERARNNDQDALTEIYNISVPAVYKVVKVLVGNEDTVLDIIQDTYIKAFTKISQLQNPDKLVPWMKMIANNTAKDWLRRAKPVFFTDLSAGEEDEIPFEEKLEDDHISMNPEQAMEEKEAKRFLMEILEQLPPDQRVVIGLFYFEQLSVREIATMLSVSENTVKSRLVYGRKKIKEEVLELEKKGTKLYTVAPFVFFMYLLRVMEESPASVPEINPGYLISKAYGHSVNQKNPVQIEQQAVKNVEPSYETMTSKAAKNAAAPTAKATARTAAKAVVGHTAKHAGLKIAAIVLTGSLGVGGAIYGVAKYADRIPVIRDIVNELTESEEETWEEPEEEITERMSEDYVWYEAPENDLQEAEVPEVEENITVEPEKESVTAPPLENVVAQGVMNPQIRWYLDMDGIFTMLHDETVSQEELLQGTSGDISSYRPQIQKVLVGEGITEIPEYAFTECENLTEASFPGTLTKIGMGAFSYCGFSHIKIPDSVKILDNDAFRRCYNLSSVEIGENSELEYIGWRAFMDAPLGTGVSNIPPTIKTIKSDAFMGGRFPEEIVFSENIEELGLNAFGAISGLSRVYFKGNAPVITDERVVIEDQSGVFSDTVLEVYYPEGNETWKNFDFSFFGKNVTAKPYIPN